MLNRDIYQCGFLLEDIAQDEFENFPITINFFIQKNIKKILKEYNQILEMRDLIVKKYGILTNSDERLYDIPLEKRDLANQELNNLLNIDNQDFQLDLIPLSLLSNIQCSAKASQIIFFMIKEDINLDNLSMQSQNITFSKPKIEEVILEAE